MIHPKPGELVTDWSTDGIVARRDRYYSASQRKFVPFEQPLIFRRGSGQYLWDEQDRRYIDLLAMNVCVSVGHAHPTVVQAASEQMAQLTHCTTMFYHPTPAHLAVLREERLQDNARRVGSALETRLRELQNRFEIIGDVRGRGLMLAIELVEDRRSKTPAAQATARVFEESRNHGLVLSKSGPHRSVLRMVPPLCLDMEDIDPIIDGLTRSLEKA